MAGAANADIADISFAGSTISLNGHKLSCFTDDANPIECTETDTCRIEWSCNGKMVRTTQPSHIIMSVSVLPGSVDDKVLYEMWINSRFDSGTPSQREQEIKADIQINSTAMAINSYHFKNGTMLRGPSGPGSRPDGKLEGRTYTFAFANVTCT